MAIATQCSCGAKIRLPDAAAGRRARCRSCGRVFRVPAAPSPVERPDTNEPAAQGAQDDIAIARWEPPVREEPAHAEQGDEPRADGYWIEDDGRTFWADAAWSFVFFLDAGNMIALITICLVRVFVMGVGMLPLLGCWAALVQATFAAWLCALYFNIVAETARGEDGLPDVWVSSFYEDLLLPALRFIGCWLIVFAPAAIAAFVLGRSSGLTWRDAVQIVTSLRKGGTLLMEEGAFWWEVTRGLAIAGLFFWPIMVLGTALGQGLPLKAIPLLVHTVVKTFAPYLVVCILVAIAMAIPLGSQRGLDLLISSPRGAGLSIAATLVLRLSIGVVEVYAWIVAMRLIGLYYRHFKSEFPWEAE